MTDIIQLAEVDIQSTLGTINTNLKEVKARIDEEFSTLLDKKITVKDIADAKRSVADARKIYNALENKRKSIKAEWNNPYVAFEAEYKETISSLTTYINNIKEQIDFIEKQEFESKNVDIHYEKNR